MPKRFPMSGGDSSKMLRQSKIKFDVMKYRADIDGLRAIAVLSVLFFHAGLQSFTGGYVGVDVFFVISGYLITKLLKEQIEAGTFSFGTFYLRRARRLFPAMFATAVVTTMIAVLLFAPPFLERFGGELIHSIASVSNVFFWLEADYFDAAAKLKPLLHTWSLGVEEQFYLIWPLLLVLALKARSRWVAPFVLVVFSIASLLANDAAVGSSALILKHFGETGVGQLLASTGLPGGKAAIYFLLPFRVFEFGVGAIIIWIETFQIRRRWMLDVLMTAGLALVGYSIFFFDEHTLFPWFNAVVPCTGTALMIYAGQESRIGKLIGLASGIGKISYSIYLVHWPLIVFTEYWLIEPPGNGVKSSMIVASILLGWLLHRFVETPYRQPKAKHKPAPGMVSKADAAFAIGMFASAAVLFLIGSNMWKYDGWKWRVDKRYAYSAAEFHLKYWGGVGYKANEFIQIGTATKKQYLFFGDSFGLQYAKALDNLAKNGAIGFKALFDHGCLILPQTITFDQGVPDNSCTVEYPKVKAEMDAHPRQDVIIAANWQDYNGLVMNPGGTKPIDFKSTEAFAAYLAAKVALLIQEGGGQRRYFVLGMPNPSYAAITCLASSAFITRHCRENIDRVNTVANATLKALAATGSNIYFIDPNDVLCDSKTCMAIKDGAPLYSDGKHLTVDGARIVSSYIESQLSKYSLEPIQNRSAQNQNRFSAVYPAS